MSIDLAKPYHAGQSPVVFVPDPAEPAFDLCAYCQTVCSLPSPQGDVFLDLRHIAFMGSTEILAVLKMRSHFLGQGLRFYVLNPSPMVLRSLQNARLDRLIESPAVRPSDSDIAALGVTER